MQPPRKTATRQGHDTPRLATAAAVAVAAAASLLAACTSPRDAGGAADAAPAQATKDQTLGTKILMRVLCMLINEAADTLYLGIASAQDIDLAMTKGVNYPKGLLKWADELGIDKIAAQLAELRDFYEEDRYRLSPLIKQKLQNGGTFSS